MASNELQSPSLIFIVPYRDRLHHKTFFDHYMRQVIMAGKRDGVDYEIIYAHQNNDLKFNRGGMKNIGFLYAKEKYPDTYEDITFVFNDVDTVPYKSGLFNYETTHGVVKHFYGYEFALGGIFSITGKDFEKANGFPNYWGWGFEDNVMQNRVNDNGFETNRNQYFTVDKYEVLHFFDDYKKKISSDVLLNQFKKKFVETDGLNTLKNIDYQFNNETNMLDINTLDGLYAYKKEGENSYIHTVFDGMTVRNPFVKQVKHQPFQMQFTQRGKK